MDYTSLSDVSPGDAGSPACNSLLEVRRGPHEVRKVQNIADILVDPKGTLERRRHWAKTSHALLIGATASRPA